MATTPAAPAPPPIPSHYVIQRAGRYLVDVFGRTVPAPFPLAMNFCIRSEAEDLARNLNSGEPDGAERWTVETLSIADICASEVDLAGTFMGDDLQEAA